MLTLSRGAGVFCVGLFLSCAAACGPSIDLRQALEVTDLSGGWFDAGIKDGKNKLVPSVSFRLRNKTDQEIDRVSLNVHFRAVDGRESSLDQDIYVQRVEFNGPTTDAIVVRPEAGYVGEGQQSRADMLKNTHFRDMRVIIFVRQSSANWVELASYDLPRQLLTE